MNDSFEILSPDDVIHTGSSALMFQCTFKVSEFLAMMQSKLEEEHLFGTGIDCDLLQPNQPWRQGKIRVCLQFATDSCPEEVEVSGAPVDSQLPEPNQLNPEKLPPYMQRKIHTVGIWS